VYLYDERGRKRRGCEVGRKRKRRKHKETKRQNEEMSERGAEAVMRASK